MRKSCAQTAGIVCRNLLNGVGSFLCGGKTVQLCHFLALTLPTRIHKQTSQLTAVLTGLIPTFHMANKKKNIYKQVFFIDSVSGELV